MNALPNRQESQWYKIELFIPIENMDGYILLFTMKSSKSPLENYIEVLGKYLFLWASLADVDFESKFSYFKDLMAVEMCLGRMYPFAGEYSGLLFCFLVSSIPSMSFLRMRNDLPRLIYN